MPQRPSSGSPNVLRRGFDPRSGRTPTRYTAGGKSEIFSKSRVQLERGRPRSPTGPTGRTRAVFKLYRRREKTARSVASANSRRFNRPVRPDRRRQNDILSSMRTAWTRERVAFRKTFSPRHRASAASARFPELMTRRANVARSCRFRNACRGYLIHRS